MENTEVRLSMVMFLLNEIETEVNKLVVPLLTANARQTIVKATLQKLQGAKEEINDIIEKCTVNIPIDDITSDDGEEDRDTLDEDGGEEGEDVIIEDEED